MPAGVVEVDELQQKLKQTTGHHRPKVVIMVWPTVTPVTVHNAFNLLYVDRTKI